MTESEQPSQRERRLRQYAAEFVVIFLSVSLSFTAENIREDRQNRAVEGESLGRLVRGMENDLRDFQINARVAEAGAEAITWIHAQGEGEPPLRDSLENHLSQFLVCSVMAANSSEYESLKSSGDLRVLRDLDFRESLTALYEMYPLVSDLHMQDCANREAVLEPVMDALRIDPARAFPRVRIDGDVTEILTNRRFLNYLSMAHSGRVVLGSLDRELISQLEDLRTRALELLADS
jgi:hypothetical protein